MNNKTVKKKVAPKIEKLNKGHWHETTDRTFVVLALVDNALRQHPTFTADQKVRELVGSIEDKLGELYQYAGTKY